MSKIKIDGHSIDFGHPDKVLFADIGFTKQDLANYYQKIAEHLLPHTKDRPISMKRFPDGIQGEGFYQKQIPDYFPDWIDHASIKVEERNEKQDQVVINQEATLVYLADQANISIHTWLSRKDKLDYPDKVIFDLDPPSDDFEPIRNGARIIRDLMQEIGLTPFVMTTGSRGLHVVMPIQRDLPFDEVRDFAKRTAHLLADQNNRALTAETSKSKREGRLFLDYLRNSYAQTSVAPYSLRARESAPVATPLDWDELGDSDLTSRSYTVENIFRRLGQKPDPWKGFFDKAGDLRQAREKLQSLEK